ncbi:MAG: hypothetical protein KAT77_03085 [Nanoarchaeota archaeon]|nr:hypothetical protein [Nanoarchaeota archaeon]
MLKPKELTAIIAERYRGIHGNNILFIVEDKVGSSQPSADLETKLFSGLRSNVEKFPIQYFVDLHALKNGELKEALRKEKMDSGEIIKQGTFQVCQKENINKADFQMALKEAKVLSLLSQYTDRVPWILGYSEDGNIARVIMEFLGDFNVGRAFKQPTNQAKEILYYLAKEQPSGVLRTELYDKFPKSLNTEEIKGCIDELVALNLIRTQRERNSQMVYLAKGFYDRYALGKSKKEEGKAVRLVEKDEFIQERWRVLKEGVVASYQLRIDASKHLKELKQIPGFGDFNFSGQGKKPPIAERMALFVFDQIERLLPANTIQSSAYIKDRTQVLPYLIKDLQILNRLKERFITHDSYADNFMRREAVSAPPEFVYPLNDESRGNKLVLLDAYHSTIGPFLLDDADFLLYARVGLGLDSNDIDSLTMFTLAEAKTHKKTFRFKSTEIGQKALAKLQITEAIRYLRANKERTDHDPSRAEKRMLDRLSDGYWSFIADSIAEKKKIFSPQVNSFLGEYLVDKAKNGGKK